VEPLAWRRAHGQYVAQHTSPYAAAVVRAEARRPPPVRLAARKVERERFLFRQRVG
jgi:hypothetical protein